MLHHEPRLPYQLSLDALSSPYRRAVRSDWSVMFAMLEKLLSTTLLAFMGHVSLTVSYMDHWHKWYFYLLVTLAALGQTYVAFQADDRGGAPLVAKGAMVAFNLTAGWLAVYGIALADWTCFFSPLDGCDQTGIFNWGFFWSVFGDLGIIMLGASIGYRGSSLAWMLRLSLAVKVIVWYYAHLLSIQQRFCDTAINSQAIFGDVLLQQAAGASDFVLNTADMTDDVAEAMPKVLQMYINIMIGIALFIGIVLGSASGESMY